VTDFDALILDMDGVLADTEPVFFEAFEVLLVGYDVTLSPEYLCSLVGHSAQKNFEDISRDFSLKLNVGECVRKLEDSYIHLLQTRTIPANPGVWALIDKSKMGELALGLCTSSSRIQTDTVLHQIWRNDRPNYPKPHDVFDAIVTGDDVTKKKPDPEPYHRITAALKTNPSQCLVIEDSASGIQSAKSAGCVCVGLRTAYNRELEFGFADGVINTMEDLI